MQPQALTAPRPEPIPLSFNAQLDALPPISARDLIKDARLQLHMAVKYGLPHDGADDYTAQKIRAAYNALTMVLGCSL